MIYEFVCEDCELIWQKEAPMAEAPKRSKCPECKKFKPKLIHSPVFHLKGDGFHATKNAYKNSRKNIDDINEFYNTATKNSKKRMKTGWQNYSRMDIDHQYFEDSGRYKKLTEKQIEARKHSTEEIGPKLRNKHTKPPQK